MGLSLIKKDLEDSMILHPFRQELTREAAGVDPVVLDNLVEIPYALDSPLHVA